MRVALWATSVLVVSLLVAGCGGGNGLAHRADLVGEVMHETLGYADLEGPSSSHSITFETIDRTQPRSRYLLVRVWDSWADTNLFLTGAPSPTSRPVGFCRQHDARRVCVVADRVTAMGAASAGSPAVVRLTRALYWGGLPGGVRWKPKAM
jgi:hypothetical protein